LCVLVVLCFWGVVWFGDLPPTIGQPAAASVTPSTDSSLDAAERAALLTALAQQHWHMSQTAVVLGVSRNTLYRKLRKYGIARQLQTSC
jgi:sigma-54 dependent transcriptional regulator, acetoin dehydrogenase operon transcriptional activator AcoR